MEPCSRRGTWDGGTGTRWVGRTVPMCHGWRLLSRTHIVDVTAPTQAIFHVLDAPAHGQGMHNLGEPNDDYFRSPPEGRNQPEVEAQRAMQRLQSLGVQRYTLCHLKREHCAKMVQKLREILRDCDIDRADEGRHRLVETEVKRDEGKRQQSCGYSFSHCARYLYVSSNGLPG